MDGGSAENVGFGLQYGRDAFRGTEHFLYKAVHGHEEWPEWFQPDAVRLEGGVGSQAMAFSPDGRWLAYQSNASGQYEIYVRSNLPQMAARYY